MKTFETIKAVGDVAEKIGGNVDIGRRIRSVAAEASNAIYYFPVVSSKSVSTSTATMISTNLEQAYASFVTACFALTPAMVVKGDKIDVTEYLKIFHQNVGIRSTKDLFLTLKESIEEWKMFPNESLNEATTSKQISSILNNANNKILKDDNYINPIVKSGNAKKSINMNYSIKDIEKKNSLRPSVIEVPVTFILKGQPINTNIPVGVKTLIHPVDPDELNNQIMDSIAGRGLLHNIIRYTTGEILSLGDMLFGISKMKKNIASSNKSDVAKWADVLEHRKRLSNLSKPASAKKGFLPNLTINISMDDVYSIDRLIGYNLLTDTFRASKFIKDMFLLALVITDDATETAYIMYDGHSNYEEYPYASLKRQNEKTSDSIDSLIKGLGLGMKM